MIRENTLHLSVKPIIYQSVNLYKLELD